MGNIGEELKKSLNKLGITRQVEAVGVVEQARDIIATFIADEDFEVISFNRGSLKIKVTSSSAGNQMFLNQNSLMKKIPEIKRVLIKN